MLTQSFAAPLSNRHTSPGFSGLTIAITLSSHGSASSVLARLPAAFAQNVGAVLLCLQEPTSTTNEAVQEWVADNPGVDVTVVHQPRSLGVGGVAKFCLLWAVERGSSVLVILPGDGHSPPELAGSVAAPILFGNAAAVLAIPGRGHRSKSRRSSSSALRVVGKMVITAIRNARSGLTLSDWRSGYRAYELTRFDFDTLCHMSDGPDFGSDIIAEFARKGRRIVEVTIPTVYRSMSKGCGCPRY